MFKNVFDEKISKRLDTQEIRFPESSIVSQLNFVFLDD